MAAWQCRNAEICMCSGMAIQALDRMGLRTVPLDDLGSMVSGKLAAAERCRFLARS